MIALPLRVSMMLLLILSIVVFSYSSSFFSSSSSLSSAYAQSSSPSSNEGGWKIAHVVGRFAYSEPPKPQQVFKIYYRVISGTIEEIKLPFYGYAHSIEARVHSSTGSGNGTLEIKFPRNYPYSDSDSAIGGDAVVFIDGLQVFSKRVVSDCFFDFSIPFTGCGSINKKIELVWTSSLTGKTFHGDKIPDRCIPETMVKYVPVRKQDGTISPLNQMRIGIAAKDIACKVGLQLVIDPNGKPYCAKESTLSMLNNRWYNMTYYYDDNNKI
jgi:hypothetical protein